MSSRMNNCTKGASSTMLHCCSMQLKREVGMKRNVGTQKKLQLYLHRFVSKSIISKQPWCCYAEIHNHLHVDTL